MKNLVKYAQLTAVLTTIVLANQLSYAGEVIFKNNHTDVANNKDWMTVTCSGFKTWQACRVQAQSACPKGFMMADQLENILIQRREVSVACKS